MYNVMYYNNNIILYRRYINHNNNIHLNTQRETNVRVEQHKYYNKDSILKELLLTDMTNVQKKAFYTLKKKKKSK